MGSQRAVVFESQGHELTGILELPESPAKRGIVIVTGGPQYRVGSHRQFVLLSRMFAARGFPVFRFDYHGMGDSSGPLSDFTKSLDDLGEAIRVFGRESGVTEVVLWGLCDAASANLMYVARNNSSVAGLVLMNPWVRSESGLARTHLRHYYLQRLFSLDLFRRLFSGDLEIRKAVAGFVDTVRNSFAAERPDQAQEEKPAGEEDFREVMLQGFSKFDRPILLMLSGDDLTANEFVDLTKRDRRWQRALRHRLVTRRSLEEADHTFSRRAWRHSVGDWTVDWLDAW